jgi:FAD/FMN-containing dehydrogenase/Fe-S oxidoreductase
MNAPISIDRSLFESLNQSLDGNVEFDSLTRKLYSTDASVYQRLPAAVAFPKSAGDIQKLIEFANTHDISLVPRTAGTSLAGQVVGNGIIVDVGKHFTTIGDIDLEKRTVVVQPGVVRDELNLKLAPHGLMFGPETSTSNRAMIGGMLGNNSCGSNSIVYGTTRDQTIEVTGFLSDGSEVTFGPLSKMEFHQKCELHTVEGEIYRTIAATLTPPENRQLISDQFPNPSIHRRNTGYAIDALMHCNSFDTQSDKPLNVCKLIAGSEGTLFFATSIKLQLHPLPPKENVLLCVHFKSVDEALRANIIAMQHPVHASELIDQLVLEGAARNISQRENLKFVEGEPGAILVLSLRGETRNQIDQLFNTIQEQLANAQLGYAFPVLSGDDIKRIWDLRKAGLGVVANVPGDAKPVAVIEDTAVSIEDLPAYIRDIDQLLIEKHDCQCVYYAHAGSGEIHMRPVIDLKKPDGVKQFRNIATDVAALVRKYNGSLSGEHGDGLARSEFIESMVGPECYDMMRQIKTAFDPKGIFNPGKIVDPWPMDRSLRFEDRPNTRELETVFDFEKTLGLQRAAEMCSGSGDCRKTAQIGGTMCPSFMATRNERDSTRARANIVRHVLAESEGDRRKLANPEIADAMDLCLACKGCKSECPSNVDVGKMKAEFQQAWHDRFGVPRRTKLIASIDRLNRIGAKFRWLSNFVVSNSVTGWLLKKSAGFATKRSLPTFSAQSLRSWFNEHTPHANANSKGRVLFFCDEFTNFNESQIGIAAIEVLEQLGWAVEMPNHLESGRASLSKGLLRNARDIASKNVKLLAPIVKDDFPLISVEPSAILSFRDEYIDLLRGEEKESAKLLAKNCLTFEEFIRREVDAGNITSKQFTSENKTIRLHGHCHEKSLIGLVPAIRTLGLPENYRVRLIPSGCCGMAGSFGYESEHFDVSMKIGELVLFPTVRSEPADSLIAATGTSCRHQIKDGTNRLALHPAEILRSALSQSKVTKKT